MKYILFLYFLDKYTLIHWDFKWFVGVPPPAPSIFFSEKVPIKSPLDALES